MKARERVSPSLRPDIVHGISLAKLEAIQILRLKASSSEVQNFCESLLGDFLKNVS